MAKIKNEPSAGEIYESTVDYMRDASLPALEEIELRRLGEAARLRQTVTETVTELIRVSSEALHAPALLGEAASLHKKLIEILTEWVRVSSEALDARTLRKMRQSDTRFLGESAALSRELVAEAIPEPQSEPPLEPQKKLGAPNRVIGALPAGGEKP